MVSSSLAYTPFGIALFSFFKEGKEEHIGVLWSAYGLLNVFDRVFVDNSR